MGVTYLLDSHAFYWLIADTRQVPARIREALDNPAAERIVSAVSAFEFSTKRRLGKFDSPIVDRWDEAVRTLTARHLPLTTEHALRAGTLDWAHKDPFDRLLAAQAIGDGLTLVTADSAFDSAPGLSLLRW